MHHPVGVVVEYIVDCVPDLRAQHEHRHTHKHTHATHATHTHRPSALINHADCTHPVGAQRGIELTQQLAHSFRCRHSYSSTTANLALLAERTLEADDDSSPITAHASTLRESSNSTGSSSGLGLLPPLSSASAIQGSSPPGQLQAKKSLHR